MDKFKKLKSVNPNKYKRISFDQLSDEYAEYLREYFKYYDRLSTLRTENIKFKPKTIKEWLNVAINCEVQGSVGCTTLDRMNKIRNSFRRSV